MIFLKEYSGLFNSPKPEFEDFNHGNYGVRNGKAEIEYLKAKEEWLSSKIEVVGEHTFQDGKDYQEGVDYIVKEIAMLNFEGDGEEVTVAIPIKEDKENGFEPSVPSNDLAPVASHSCTSSDSIEHEGGYYYELFEFFSQRHDLILLDSEIQDIIHAVESFKNKTP
jgi:hypothetical protein